MKKNITLIFLFISLNVIATTQNSEVLIYKSETLFTSNFPLDLLIKKNSLIKHHITRYAYRTCQISSCNRGYNGTWEIRGNSLYLVKLETACGDHTFDLKKIFRKRRIINGKMFASWYSGVIKAYYPIGKFTDLDATKYNTKTMTATIKRGKIVDIVIEPANYYQFQILDKETESFEELEHLDKMNEKK